LIEFFTLYDLDEKDKTLVAKKNIDKIVVNTFPDWSCDPRSVFYWKYCRQTVLKLEVYNDRVELFGAWNPSEQQCIDRMA
jgi:hypothetical protein